MYLLILSFFLFGYSNVIYRLRNFASAMQIYLVIIYLYGGKKLKLSAITLVGLNSQGIRTVNNNTSSQCHSRRRVFVFYFFFPKCLFGAIILLILFYFLGCKNKFKNNLKK